MDRVDMERKLRLFLDSSHGEDVGHTGPYEKLIRFLYERCDVEVLKKKPVDQAQISAANIFVIISPSKPWEDSEIETVRTYVENQGGILLVMTLGRRKPEYLNKLLEPFGISVGRDEVQKKELEVDSLQGLEALLKDIELLACGDEWGKYSVAAQVSTGVEVVLQYNDKILGTRCPVGNGTVYLFTCLPVFAKKQLDRVDNRKLLYNLLQYVGWEPSWEDERSCYLISKTHTESLKRDLEHAEDKDIRIQAVQALGEIGDTNVIDSLCSGAIPLKGTREGQFDWEYYNALLPVVADALANIGKSNVEHIIKALKGKELLLMWGIPLMWALCKIGDHRAVETVINWIFSVGTIEPMVPGSYGAPLVHYGEFLSPPDVIRACVPPNLIPQLLGNYTDIVLDIFAWKFVSVSEETGEMQFDMSRSTQAVQQLCAIKTDVSSNILHKVSGIERLNVGGGQIGIEVTVQYLDFKDNREMAVEELKRRGKPRYEPSTYLEPNAWTI
jgi:hypothetical protein